MPFWDLGRVKPREPRRRYTEHRLDPAIVAGSEVGPVDTVAAEDHPVSRHSGQDSPALRLPAPGLSLRPATGPACSGAGLKGGRTLGLHHCHMLSYAVLLIIQHTPLFPVGSELLVGFFTPVLSPAPSSLPQRHSVLSPPSSLLLPFLLFVCPLSIPASVFCAWPMHSAKCYQGADKTAPQGPCSPHTETKHKHSDAMNRHRAGAVGRGGSTRCYLPLVGKGCELRPSGGRGQGSAREGLRTGGGVGPLLQVNSATPDNSPANNRGWQDH